MPRAPESGRQFERYALLATFVLIVAALVVRDRVLAPDEAPPRSESDDVLRVVLGGPDSDQHIATVARTRPRAPIVVRDPHSAPVPPPSPAIPPREEPAPAPETAPRPRTYVVKPGETLSEIAARELGTVRRMPELARLNGITDRNRLRAGQTLTLPAE